jgi:hypothetical protein
VPQPVSYPSKYVTGCGRSDEDPRRSTSSVTGWPPRLCPPVIPSGELTSRWWELRSSGRPSARPCHSAIGVLGRDRRCRKTLVPWRGSRSRPAHRQARVVSGDLQPSYVGSTPQKKGRGWHRRFRRNSFQAPGWSLSRGRIRRHSSSESIRRRTGVVFRISSGVFRVKPMSGRPFALRYT